MCVKSQQYVQYKLVYFDTVLLIVIYSYINNNNILASFEFIIYIYITNIIKLNKLLLDTYYNYNSLI